jgi:hypothetical protein
VRLYGPRSAEEAAHMNARIKEKKLQLKLAKPPQKPSDFLNLADHMKQWFADNPNIRNLLTYAYKNGYTWTQFKKWRKDSEIFAHALETCFQICLERREEYLDKDKKLSASYLREQPLYNPILADYEIEKSKNDSSVLDKYAQIALTQYQPLAQGIKDKEKE